MHAAAEEYVSRGGVKLAGALDGFGLKPAGWVCLDLGSHVGGFVDCLLRRGAARVHAVDPGTGVLDARLRADARVVVHEDTNALRFDAPELCELVTVDAGWTPQRLVLPAARRALKSGGVIVTLVKPQYEAPAAWRRGGVVPADRQAAVLALVHEDVADLRLRVAGELASPIAGHGGNREWFFLIRAD